MDQEIADKLGCQLLPTGLTRVSVVDGSRLAVSAKINNFEWHLQSLTFEADFMAIPLGGGGGDMVLGVQWL